MQRSVPQVCRAITHCHLLPACAARAVSSTPNRQTHASRPGGLQRRRSGKQTIANAFPPSRHSPNAHRRAVLPVTPIVTRSHDNASSLRPAVVTALLQSDLRPQKPNFKFFKSYPSPFALRPQFDRSVSSSYEDLYASMPYFANSPEARLGRSDSKNPATTCKGLTLDGKSCRRAIAKLNSPNESLGGSGVLAIIRHIAGSEQDAAAYYCYQHKDQAPSGSTLTDTSGLDLKNRTSIDTLMNRLGVLNVEDDEDAITTPKEKKQNAPGSTPVKRNTLPQQWQGVPGPFMAVPDAITQHRPQPQHQPQQQQFVKPRHREYNLLCFCCGSSDDARPAPKPARPTPRPTPIAALPMSSIHPRPSQTAALNSWIPPSVPPPAHARLLAELSKPLSKQDTDSGYIYMFWETPAAAPQPTAELARSLIQGAWDNRGQLVHDARHAKDDLLQDPWNAARTLGAGIRRPSDAMRAASQSDKAEVKIGRADNVQKRMDQWTRQCGKKITLLQYYPYVPSSGSSPSGSPRRTKGVARPEPGQTPAKPGHPGPVPNCARVERLIHIELADQRIKKNCAACGREHREWFGIDATEDGVRKVNEVIRRWVRWGEEKAKESI